MRLTRRDWGVLSFFVMLSAAVVLVASIGFTRWALITLGMLVGVAAVADHVRFVARRRSFQQLAREIRATRESVSSLVRSAAVLNRVSTRTERNLEALRDDILAIRRDVVAVRGAAESARSEAVAAFGELAATRGELAIAFGEISATRGEVAASHAAIGDAAELLSGVLTSTSDLLKKDLGTTRQTTEALRDEIGSIAAEALALRSELRGMRVAQQLLSQTLTITRNELLDQVSQKTVLTPTEADHKASAVGP